MPYRRRKRIIFAEFALIPMLLIAAALWMRARHSQDLLMVDHTREVQTTIADVYAPLADAETARRQFIITGDPEGLARLNADTQQVNDSLQRLERLVQDNPTQQQNVHRLEDIANQRLDLLKETSQFGRGTSADDAVQSMEKESGLALSAGIREITSLLTAEEDRLLKVRKQQAAVADLELNILFAAAAAACVGLILFANRAIKQYAGERNQAEAAWVESNRALRGKMAELDELNLELETRVRERTESLESINRELQQFAYVASHDLQEPLRMIVTYIGLIEKSFQGKLDADVGKYLSVATGGAKRMQVLIGDILSYARAGSENLSLVPSKLSVPLNQAQYSLMVSIQEAGAEIISGPLPDVEIDAIKMSLVFQNLISNAIKFRKPGQRPRIHIEAGKVSRTGAAAAAAPMAPAMATTAVAAIAVAGGATPAKNGARNGAAYGAAAEDGSEWQISVRDEGIGFDPKYAEKIFGVFQRLHPASKYPGTGIGLAMCKRIIEGHGGRIWAEADPGEGAIFFFTLPALADVHSVAASRAS